MAWRPRRLAWAKRSGRDWSPAKRDEAGFLATPEFRLAPPLTQPAPWLPALPVGSAETRAAGCFTLLFHPTLYVLYVIFQLTALFLILFFSLVVGPARIVLVEPAWIALVVGPARIGFDS